MKSVTARMILTYFLVFLAMFIGIALIAYFFMNNQPFQVPYVIRTGLLIWISATITGSALIAIKTRPLDKKLEKLNDLHNGELKQLVQGLSRVPLVLVIIMVAANILAYLSYFIILRQQGFHIIDSAGTLVLAAVGSIGVGELMFFIPGYILRKNFAEVSLKLHQHSISAPSTFIGYRFKLYYAFSATLISIILWLLAFGYYFHLNTSLAREQEEAAWFQRSIMDNLPEEIKQEQNPARLVRFLQKQSYDQDRVIMLADTDGTIIFRSRETPLYVKHWKQTNQKLKADFSQGNSGGFYENEHGNLLVYRPINDEYTLVFAKNVMAIARKMGSFWFWALAFAGIGIFFLFINSYILSEWIVISQKSIARLINAVEKGDLTLYSGKGAEDETGTMVASYNQLLDKLRDTFTKSKSHADVALKASNELSSMAQVVAKGASEQAATTEEISGTMEEMAGQLQQNDSSAQNTLKLSNTVSSDISKLSESVKQTRAAMQQIKDKISVIHDISEKTDLLAVNAGIEAARAGGHGNGFAVVAQEVRALAENTSKAAGEISSLAASSSQRAYETSNSLQSALPNIQETINAIREIAASTQHQRQGVEQVNTSLQQLVQITNQNSSAAEELSTSADELKARANDTRNVLAYFTLEKKAPEHTDFTAEIRKLIAGS